MLSLTIGLLGFCSHFVHAAIVPGKAFDRFISIWLENQDFGKVVADPDFADLKRFGILQTRYYAQTHPSQPNYIAAVGGDYFGLDHDEFVRIPSNVSTVVDLFDEKRISWRGYFEGNPGPGYMAEGSYDINGMWDYVRKHNPFVSYDSVNKNGSRLMNLLSFEDFKNDLAAGTVPQFVMMSPDMLNDGHNTTLDYATKWAHKFLLPLLVDGVFKEKTLIQLTYDETEDYSKPNRIVSLLLGSAVPNSLKGTEDNTFYTHFSILATAENNWDLPNLGRFDVGANVFKLVADVTGYDNKDPSNIATVNNSVSYPGAFNRNHTTRLTAIPPPNLQLVGAGGQPVLNLVREHWKASANTDTPYDGSGSVYDGDHAPIYNPQARNDVI
ncbi:putative acid phosphatase Pho610 [Annulohypoxylon maeteangense]|uniref:putative acid phosphatase Pho610 n=1 Tax=Annulohypoxylon maeteangense TaxID=1927788 RepID=UPI00200838DE|nr:putative acid phosphatase Pho610 [Annulohypoxylon maeteangense]KAI0884523.1 putative acid phosphatase Pho610 [Annulohypoxylon maeteangense]